jgi:hypothetical protein
MHLPCQIVQDFGKQRKMNVNVNLNGPMRVDCANVMQVEQNSRLRLPSGSAVPRTAT